MQNFKGINSRQNKMQLKSPISKTRAIPFKNIRYKKGKNQKAFKINKNSSELSTASNQASKELDFSKLKF